MRLNRTHHPKTLYTERVLQFGEGNFLRCFIDWQLDILNEEKGLDAGVVIVRPIDTDFPPSLNSQDGLYTTIIRGYDDQGTLHEDSRLIGSVTRELSVYRQFDQFLELAGNPDLEFIVSNTTEAGIAYDPKDSFTDAPPSTYPAKLCRLLYERYRRVEGDTSKGFILLPCELIDHNGRELERIVGEYASQWELGQGFQSWLEEANTFCSTLVDRIVTGYPAKEASRLEEQLGYQDSFITTSEYFHLFVIEGPAWLADRLRISGSGLDIRIVEDLMPYKQRKVGILNGAHTALVPVAYQCGIDLVRDAVADPLLERFLDSLIEDEIIPSLPLDPEYAREFASSVIARFKNPYIDHRLLDISLNSMTKFKTRLLPQLLRAVERTLTVPPLMAFSLAALIHFYRGERKEGVYELKDDPRFLELFRGLYADGSSEEQLTDAVLRLSDHWGRDLRELAGLAETVTAHLRAIRAQGMREALEEVIK